MTELYRIFCDESGHLENDRVDIMVLGAVWCPADFVRQSASRLREIKKRHGLSTRCELKWGSVSPSKREYYRDVLDYWADTDELCFRALVADKRQLNHEKYGHDHDTWYHKIYFEMLKLILDPDARYEIYLDIKDTRSAAKVRKLHEVLCNNIYDFRHSIVQRLQTVRSHEVEHVQLADFLVGLVGFANREGGESRVKKALVSRMQHRTGYALTRTTLVRSRKVNLLVWRGSARDV